MAIAPLETETRTNNFDLPKLPSGKTILRRVSTWSNNVLDTLSTKLF